MFTGLVQNVSEIVSLEARSEGGRLAVRAAAWPGPVEIGESIAVNGVCLTVAAAERDVLVFDVLAETLEKTSLGAKHAGSPVNLERALRAGDAMGGHTVTGHVDGVGDVLAIMPKGEDRVLKVGCRPELTEGMVEKGSVACDGVSLTIVDLSAEAFSVHVIPHTWGHTAFRALHRGDKVNIETDILGKYIRKYLGAAGVPSRITGETLRKAGFG